MRRLLVTLLPALAGLAAAAPARADDLVAQISRDTPVAAYGGTRAWSAYDATTDRFRLVIAEPGAAPQVANVAPARAPFDVSLGPDAHGVTAALYTRCKRVDTGCDIYRLYGMQREHIVGVSSPREDEAWPVQWGVRLAYVRRHRTGGRGEIRDCDVPFIKILSSTRPSRRLDRGSCGSTTGMSIRKDRIVQVTFGTPPSATRFDSQVRLLSARGGAVRVLARQGAGEESNSLHSPSQSAGAAYVTRTGVHPRPTFVRIDLRTGRQTEALARTNLTGQLARDARDGSFYYVEGGEFGGDSCDSAAPGHCRIVRSSADPFSRAERALLPALTIHSPTDRAVPPVRVTDPLVLSGTLTRAVVSRGALVRREPQAGIAIELLRRVFDATQPQLGERFEETGIVVRTGADGSWSHSLVAPPSEPWFSALTRQDGYPQTYAGRGTVGSVQATVTLTRSGTTFSGTVTPAQPGRTVKLQRLSSRKCRMIGGERNCVDTWDDVASAPLDAAGSAYAVVVAAPQAGSYRATLARAERMPGSYEGSSPEIPVTG